MKIIKDEIATIKRGRRVTVELAPNEFLTTFKANYYYRLGGQVDDIVSGHVLIAMHTVHWCSITQAWVEA